jgi:hypothetical protein
MVDLSTYNKKMKTDIGGKFPATAYFGVMCFSHGVNQ